MTKLMEHKPSDAGTDEVEGASAEELASAAVIGQELLADELPTESEADPPENPSQGVEQAEMSAVDGIKAHLDAAIALLTALTGEPSDQVPDETPDEMPDETTAESFAEMDAAIVRIVEQDAPVNRRAPLTMDVALIKVGAGNKKDNHYYTSEMLERDGPVFEGVTMHTVDHNESQRRESTDVSTVTKVLGVKELQDGAYLVGSVLAYDPDFCEKTRNRADAGQLGKLQCSILALGEAIEQEIEGETYNVVQNITEARFVDWVTRAGAGGHALQLAENEPVTEDDEDAPEEITEGGDPKTVLLSEDNEEPQPLTALEVVAVIGEKSPHLAASSVATLLESEYTALTDVNTALDAEIARLKESGSGQPFALGALKEKRPISQAEITASLNQVNQHWLGGR